jgi:hypothetical protein
MFTESGLRHDSVLSVTFCLLPMLSFPVFLFGFWRIRHSVLLHCLLAVAYLAIYSIMDWRTCAEHDICGSALATVAKTFTAPAVEATFAVAISHLVALRLYRKRQSEKI